LNGKELVPIGYHETPDLREHKSTQKAEPEGRNTVDEAAAEDVVEDARQDAERAEGVHYGQRGARGYEDDVGGSEIWR
jgi:hypothetical protein